MSDLRCVPAAARDFAIHRAVYADENTGICFDWAERLGHETPEGRGFFLLGGGGALLGGFALDARRLRLPFLAPPFFDRAAFWRAALRFARERCGPGEIALSGICAQDAALLTENFGLTARSAQRRMLRPTAPLAADPPPGFAFAEPTRADIPEIVETVYAAHAEGFTSTVRPPDRAEIDAAIRGRYAAFGATDTLRLGTLARAVGDGALAGVCIAGIYPDSADAFSTIHQLSVHPCFRRRGLAGAMLRRSIGRAHAVSPVITLGVMVGNPAEHLYRKLGFRAGPSYAEMVYNEPNDL